MGEKRKLIERTLVAEDNPEGNLPAEPLSRREQFLENLGKYRKWEDAAIAAGYSESYAKTVECRLRRSPAFMEKLIKRYGHDAAVMNLPRIRKIRDSIYDRVQENPEEEPKYKHIFKQDLQIAGVLSDEPVQSSTVINIGNIRELMLQVCQERQRQLDHSQTIEAEVEE